MKIKEINVCWTQRGWTVDAYIAWQGKKQFSARHDNFMSSELMGYGYEKKWSWIPLLIKFMWKVRRKVRRWEKDALPERKAAGWV